MSKWHWSFNEREEYEKGRQDERLGRSDYDHEKYFGTDSDRAYFEGREDFRREREAERMEEERLEEERM